MLGEWEPLWWFRPLFKYKDQRRDLFENQSARFYIRYYFMHTDWSLQIPFNFLSWDSHYLFAYSLKLEYSQLAFTVTSIAIMQGFVI